MTLTLDRPRDVTTTGSQLLLCSDCGMRLESPAQTVPQRCVWCEREIGGG